MGTHLLGIAGMTAGEVTAMLDEAEPWIDFGRARRRADDRLAGLTQINAFFENSTRTLFSFEIAGKRLGAQVSSFHVESSSVKKGETLIDTALTLDAMRPDVIVVRHAMEGAAAQVAAVVGCPVVNAGDGAGEHPTQALLDALTIRRRFGRVAGLTIAICGDIRHSRVAGSNLIALPLLGARVRLAAPPGLLPDHVPDGVEATSDMDAAIAGADVVMMLRIQRERIDAAMLAGDPLMASPGAYADRYKLTRARLALAAPHAAVMHPGPMNRGVEIDSDVADDPDRSLIRDQVEAGVAVRMAVLDRLTRDRRSG